MSYPQLSGHSTTSSAASSHLIPDAAMKNTRHLQQLIEFNQDIFRRNVLTDVELLVDGSIFKSHRSVLICFSPYLRRKLLSLDGQPLTSKVVIPKVGCEEFEILLRYMYTGVLQVNCNIFYDVFKAASFLEMKDVKHECLQMLSDKEEQLRSYFFVYVMSKKMGIQSNWFKSFKLIVNRFEEAVFSREFLRVDIDCAVEILSAQQIGARSEVIVFLGGLNWLNFDYQAREIYSVSIMECVRFTSMTMEEIIACYHPPFLSQIIQVPEITMMMFKATCYVTAKSLGQDSWFKLYAGPRRNLTLQGMPLELWNKGEPPETNVINPQSLWPELNSKTTSEYSDTHSNWEGEFDKVPVLPTVKKHSGELLKEALSSKQEPVKDDADIISTQPEKDESQPFETSKSSSQYEGWTSELNPSQQQRPLDQQSSSSFATSSIGDKLPSLDSDYYRTALAERRRLRDQGNGSKGSDLKESFRHAASDLQQDFSSELNGASIDEPHRSSSLPVALTDSRRTTDRSRRSVIRKSTLMPVEEVVEEIMETLSSESSSDPLRVLKTVTDELDSAKSQQDKTERPCKVWSTVMKKIDSLQQLSGQSISSDKVTASDRPTADEVLETLDRHCESHTDAAEVLKKVLDEIGNSELRQSLKLSGKSSNAFKKSEGRRESEASKLSSGQPSETTRKSQTGAKSKSQEYRRVSSNRKPEMSTERRSTLPSLSKTPPERPATTYSDLKDSIVDKFLETEIFEVTDDEPVSERTLSYVDVENVLRTLAEHSDTRSSAIEVLRGVVQEIARSKSTLFPEPTPAMRSLDVALTELQRMEPDYGEVEEGQVTQDALEQVLNVLPERGQDRQSAMITLRKVVDVLGDPEALMGPQSSSSSVNQYRRDASMVDQSGHASSDMINQPTPRKSSQVAGEAKTPSKTMSESKVKEILRKLSNQTDRRSDALEIVRRVVSEIKRPRFPSSLHSKALRKWNSVLNQLQYLEAEPPSDREVSRESVRQVMEVLPDKGSHVGKAMDILSKVVIEMGNVRFGSQSSNTAGFKWYSAAKKLQESSFDDDVPTSVQPKAPKYSHLSPSQSPSTQDESFIGQDPLCDENVCQVIQTLAYHSENRAESLSILKRVLSRIAECSRSLNIKETNAMRKLDRALSELQMLEESDQSEEGTVSEDSVDDVLRSLPDPGENMLYRIETLKKVISFMGQPESFDAMRLSVSGKYEKEDPSKSFSSDEQFTKRESQSKRQSELAGRRRQTTDGSISILVSNEEVKGVIQTLAEKSYNRSHAIEILRQSFNKIGNTQTQSERYSIHKELDALQNAEPSRVSSSDVLDETVEEVIQVLPEHELKAVETLKKVISMMGKSKTCGGIPSVDKWKSPSKSFRDSHGSRYHSVPGKDDDSISFRRSLKSFLADKEESISEICNPEAAERVKDVIQVLSAQTQSSTDAIETLKETIRTMSRRLSSIPGTSPVRAWGSILKDLKDMEPDDISEKKPVPDENVEQVVEVIPDHWSQLQTLEVLKVVTRIIKEAKEECVTMSPSTTFWTADGKRKSALSSETSSSQRVRVPSQELSSEQSVLFRRSLQSFVSEKIDSTIEDGRRDTGDHVKSVINVLSTQSVSPSHAVETLKEAVRTMNKRLSLAPGKSPIRAWGSVLKDLQNIEPDDITRKTPVPDEEVENVLDVLPDQNNQLKSLEVLRIVTRIISKAKQQCATVSPSTFFWMSSGSRKSGSGGKTSGMTLADEGRDSQRYSSPIKELSTRHSNMFKRSLHSFVTEKVKSSVSNTSTETANHVSEVVDLLANQSESPSHAVETLKEAVRSMSRRLSLSPTMSPIRAWNSILKDLQSIEPDDITSKDPVPDEHVERVMKVMPDHRNQLKTLEVLRIVTDIISKAKKECATVSPSTTFWWSDKKSDVGMPDSRHSTLHEEPIDKEVDGYNFRTFPKEQEGNALEASDIDLSNHALEVIRVLSTQNNSPAVAVETLKKAIRTISKEVRFKEGPGFTSTQMLENVLQDLQDLQPDGIRKMSVSDQHVEQILDVMPEEGRHKVKTVEILQMVTRIIGEAKSICKQDTSSMFWSNLVSVPQEEARQLRTHSVPNPKHPLEKFIMMNSLHRSFPSSPNSTFPQNTSLKDYPFRKSVQSILSERMGTPASNDHVKDVLDVLSRQSESPSEAAETLKMAVRTMSKRFSQSPSTSPSRMWGVVLKDLKKIEPDSGRKHPVSEEQVDEVLSVMPEQSRNQTKTLEVLKAVTQVVSEAKSQCDEIASIGSWEKSMKEIKDSSIKSSYSSRDPDYHSSRDGIGIVDAVENNTENTKNPSFASRSSSQQKTLEQSPSRRSSAGDDQVEGVFQTLVKQSSSRSNAIEILDTVAKRISQLRPSGSQQWKDISQGIKKIESKTEEGPDFHVSEEAVVEVIRSLEDNSQSESNAADVLKGVVDKLDDTKIPDSPTKPLKASSWETVLKGKVNPDPHITTHQSFGTHVSMQKSDDFHNPSTRGRVITSDEFFEGIGYSTTESSSGKVGPSGSGDPPVGIKSSEEFFQDILSLERKLPSQVHHGRSSSFGVFPVEEDRLESDKAIRSASSLSFTTESFHSPRSQNGKKPQILIIGGMNPKNLHKMGIGIMLLNFDPKKNKWTRYNSLPEPRHNHCAAYLNNCVYVIGGCDPRTTLEHNRYVPLSTCFKLDTRSQKWNQAASMCFRRLDHGLAKHNGLLFAIGGQDENERVLKSVEVYDPKKNKWKLLTSEMCCGRKAMGVAAYNNRIWIAGGLVQPDQEVNLQAISHVDCYDPKEKKWYFNVHMLPSPRCYCSLTVCGGLLYCVGGIVRREKVVPSNEVLCFNNDAKMWNAAPSLPCARIGSLGVAFGQTLIVVGGLDAENDTNVKNVHYLKPGALLWEDGASLPTRVYGFAAIAVQ